MTKLKKEENDYLSLMFQAINGLEKLTMQDLLIGDSGETLVHEFRLSAPNNVKTLDS